MDSGWLERLFFFLVFYFFGSLLSSSPVSYPLAIGSRSDSNGVFIAGRLNAKHRREPVFLHLVSNQTWRCSMSMQSCFHRAADNAYSHVLLLWLRACGKYFPNRICSEVHVVHECNTGGQWMHEIE